MTLRAAATAMAASAALPPAFKISVGRERVNEVSTTGIARILQIWERGEEGASLLILMP